MGLLDEKNKKIVGDDTPGTDVDVSTDDTSSDVALIPKTKKYVIKKDTKLTTTKDISLAPKNKGAYDGTAPKVGTLKEFNTFKKIDDYNLSDDNRDAVEGRLRSGMTLFDALENTPVGRAMKTLQNLDDYDVGAGPQGLTNLDVNVEKMRAAVISSGADKDTMYRHSKALNIIANAQAKGMNVVRSDDGRYWIESIENGERKYVINGLLDIKDVIDKFQGKAPKDIIDNDNDDDDDDDDIGGDDGDDG